MNFELATKTLEKQNLLLKNKNGKYLIKKYLYSDCHYLSKALSESLNIENIVIFYLEKSGRIIHSAVKYDNENILDILGKREKKEVSNFYDVQSDIFGIYHTEGVCKTMVVKTEDFDQKQFYTNDNYQKNIILDETKSWFEKIL